jgi:hypothetical protein
MDILALLKNGTRVKATRSGKTKQGVFINSPEGKGFKLDGDPNLYSLSGFAVPEEYTDYRQFRINV